MNFLFPGILFGLFFLAIPLVLHLFNLRRFQKVEFTNVSMLKDIELRSKSVRKLKQWIILVLRMLAITFLVLAFAQPVITNEANTIEDSEAVVVFVDNSLSMQQLQGNSTLLERAKNTASSILQENSSSSSYHLMTNDARQTELNSLDKESMQTLLQEVSASPERKTTSDLVSRIESIKEENNYQSIQVYFVTDFQANQFNIKEIDTIRGVQWNFLALQSDNNNNISLDSCWLSGVGNCLQSSDSLFFKVSNYGDDLVENKSVKLFIGEAQNGLSNVTLNPGESKIFSIPIEWNEFGSFKARLEWNDNLAAFDNKLFFTLTVDSNFKVYFIGESSWEQALRKLYSSPVEFRSDFESNINIDYLDEASLVLLEAGHDYSEGILNKVLDQVSNGSSLCIFPKDGNSISEFNLLLSRLKLESIESYKTDTLSFFSLNEKSSLMKNSLEDYPDNPLLPSLKGYYEINGKSGLAKENVLMITESDPGIRQYNYGKGKVYSLLFDPNPDNGNFTRQPIFVPIMLNMAYFSTSNPELYYEIGQNNLIPVPKENDQDAVWHILNDNTDIIPGTRKIKGNNYISIEDEIQVAGLYKLASSKISNRWLAFNYSRHESDFTTLDVSQIESDISESGLDARFLAGSEEEITQASLSADKALNLWKYCIILALLFIIFEVAVIKFVKA